MSHEQPTVGAIGFEIFIATGLDLSTATNIKIKYKKPDGATGEWTATSATKPAPRSNTTYGAKYVTTAVGDLDQAGDWTLQVAVVMPGFTGAGKPATLTVLGAI